jgi:hypothetical protein
MRSAPGRSKDRYRQLDVSAARQAGLPFNGTLMLVTVDPGDNTLINLTFDAPMLWIGLVDTSDWTFGANTVTGTENFTNGGRSMQCHLSGAAAEGDSWHIECANESNYLASINGGRVNTTDGLIAAPPASTNFNVTSVNMVIANRVKINFDANIALLGNNSNNPFADFSGCALGSATITGIQRLNTNSMTLQTSGTVTSGSAFSIGPAPFISTQAQSLNNATGTIAPP